MIMLLTEEENIREVIAFPMNSNAQDLLLGSPGEVTEQQLREVHIKLKIKAAFAVIYSNSKGELYII